MSEIFSTLLDRETQSIVDKFEEVAENAEIEPPQIQESLEVENVQGQEQETNNEALSDYEEIRYVHW